MFLAALCVALDRGEEQEAEAILQRALSTGASGQLPFRFELELQGAMLSAFQGRPGLAREHLGHAGPHAGIPWYPRLAEAVVAAAQGELAAAREALDAWEASRQSSPDPARLLVGNQWARDRLEALLAAEAPTRPQFASAQEATRVG